VKSAKLQESTRPTPPAYPDSRSFRAGIFSEQRNNALGKPFYGRYVRQKGRANRLPAGRFNIFSYCHALIAIKEY
jgi:hypothetical protein